MAEIDEITLNAAELARLLSVNKATISKYVTERGLPKRSRGVYGLVECVQWYCRYLMVRADHGDDSDLNSEKKKLVTAQRKRHELEIEIKKGKLLEVDFVLNKVQEIAGLFASQLEGLPARGAGVLASVSDPAEISRILQDECRTIRVSTATAILDLTDPKVGESDSQPAAKKKRGRVGRRKSNPSARKSRAGTVANK